MPVGICAFPYPMSEPEQDDDFATFEAVAPAPAPEAEATKPCTAYAFWPDHGCRTWPSCTRTIKTSGHVVPTLHKRKGATNDFTLAGRNEICAGPPDFDDGPGATPTDAACKAHCLKGDHGGGHKGPPKPPPTPSGPTTVTIHTDTVTHQISPLAMGCHSVSVIPFTPRPNRHRAPNRCSRRVGCRTADTRTRRGASTRK